MRTDGGQFIGHDTDQLGDGTNGDSWPEDVMLEQFTAASTSYCWQEGWGVHYAPRHDGEAIRKFASLQWVSMFTVDIPVSPMPQIIEGEIFAEIGNRQDSSELVEVEMTLGEPGIMRGRQRGQSFAKVSATQLLSGTGGSVEPMPDPNLAVRPQGDIDTELGWLQLQIWMREGRVWNNLPAGLSNSTATDLEFEGDSFRHSDQNIQPDHGLRITTAKKNIDNVEADVIDTVDIPNTSDERTAYGLTPSKDPIFSDGSGGSYDLRALDYIKLHAVHIRAKYEEKNTKQYAPKDDKTMLANMPVRGEDVTEHPARQQQTFQQPRIKLMGPHGENRSEWSDDTPTMWNHTWADNVNGDGWYEIEQRDMRLDVDQGRVLARTRWLPTTITLERDDRNADNRDLANFLQRPKRSDEDLYGVTAPWQFRARLEQLVDGSAWSSANTIAEGIVSADGTNLREFIHYAQANTGPASWLQGIYFARSWGNNRFNRSYIEGYLHDADQPLIAQHVVNFDLGFDGSSFDVTKPVRFVLEVKGPTDNEILDPPDTSSSASEQLLSLVGLTVVEQGL